MKNHDDRYNDGAWFLIRWRSSHWYEYNLSKIVDVLYVFGFVFDQLVSSPRRLGDQPELILTDGNLNYPFLFWSSITLGSNLYQYSNWGY